MKKFYLLLFFLGTFALISQNKKSIDKDAKLSDVYKDNMWWDLQKYELSISVDFNKKSVTGSNKIYYTVIRDSKKMKIDLQAPLLITEIRQNNKLLDFKTINNGYLIFLKHPQNIGSVESISIKFSGKPKATKNAPWEGGFTWTRDELGEHFVATSCQSEGASLWWPCKNHLYDEPELGVELSYTVPSNLVAVGNGRLTSTTLDSINKTKTYHWKVTNPINNYGIQFSAGNYAQIAEKHSGEFGYLDCDYYVLKQHLNQAKTHFQQVHKMLDAFEYWFGPYPFYEDGYKIIEVPYLGMEHQSAIGYGNNFENGYNGTDLSGTGWGMKFDFIIIHESGHEWFGNSITNKNVADMWIHESFTNYSEALYLNYHFSEKAASEYIAGIRKSIKNDKPIIGLYEKNIKGSDDMYFKGANMLHTIRYCIGDETVWRKMLKGLNSTFHHTIVTTKDIENYISNFTNTDFSAIFQQYLRTTKIPALEYKISKKSLKYRWSNCVKKFEMPVIIKLNNVEIKIIPSTRWKKIKLSNKIESLEVDKNFYIESKEIN